MYCMKNREHMELAVNLARECKHKIKVGAVVVLNGDVIGTGIKGETERNEHAEVIAIARAKEKHTDLSEATIYTTLEPCIPTSHSNSNCAKLILDSNISNIVIGRFDPNPEIYRMGWRELVNARRTVYDFDNDLRDLLDRINNVFVGFFQKGNPVSNHGAVFDYTSNGGNYRIYFDEDECRYVDTYWGIKGTKTIWARRNQHPSQVAKALYATEFDQIDNPSAYDFKSNSVSIDENEIAIFKNNYGCVLVKVERVLSGGDYDEGPPSVKIVFEVRPIETYS